MVNWETRYQQLRDDALGRGIDLDAVEQSLRRQTIETPSWGYADSGTRFGAFRMAGAPSTVEEKLQDAAQANRFTGIAPAVALHIPWDTCADWNILRTVATDLGLTIGAINPNLFQEDCYRFGSMTAQSRDVRSRAIAHVKECIEVMRSVGSHAISLWLADGTNFPGQDDFRARKHRLQESLREVHSGMREDESLLIEYKPFEPAFYHTDIADWGMAYALAAALGKNARVLVDLGHHLPGANIEQIVAFLMDENRLGGFHFNARKYADDDLTAGSVNPYELFLIYVELVKAERSNDAGAVAYMIDESHTLKNKIEEMIQSLVALQTAYARALLVDFDRLRDAQGREDLVDAEETVKDAFAIDVRPLLWKVRSVLNLPDPADPIRGFRESGYARTVARSRGIGAGSGLGA